MALLSCHVAPLSERQKPGMFQEEERTVESQGYTCSRVDTVPAEHAGNPGFNPRAWWHILEILALEKWSQEEQRFKVILCYHSEFEVSMRNLGACL